MPPHPGLQPGDGALYLNQNEKPAGAHKPVGFCFFRIHHPLALGCWHTDPEVDRSGTNDPERNQEVIKEKWQEKSNKFVHKLLCVLPALPRLHCTGPWQSHAHHKRGDCLALICFIWLALANCLYYIQSGALILLRFRTNAPFCHSILLFGRQTVSCRRQPESSL